MQASSILNVLGSILIALAISACAKVPQTETIEVKTTPIKQSAPIVPRVDDLKLRDLEWIVVTEQNYQGVLMRLRDAGQEPVMYALSSNGYANLMMNQNDVMKMIRQQQEVIAVYRKSYFDSCC